MRYTINLATRTYLDQRLFKKVAYSSIIILLIITAWNVISVSLNWGKQSSINNEIEAIYSKLGAKPGGVSDADFTNQKSHIKFYNEIIERKTKNWLDLLDLLENVTPDGISLSSLAPGKNQEDLKLEGRARSFKSVQQYLEKLESSKNFSNVLLLSHQNLIQGENSRGVQFSISCKVVN
jgi:type IV pilus assembly protein PilN